MNNSVYLISNPPEELLLHCIAKKSYCISIGISFSVSFLYMEETPDEQDLFCKHKKTMSPKVHFSDSKEKLHTQQLKC